MNTYINDPSSFSVCDICDEVLDPNTDKQLHNCRPNQVNQSIGTNMQNHVTKCEKCGQILYKGNKTHAMNCKGNQ